VYVGWKRRGNEQEVTKTEECAMYGRMETGGYMPGKNQTILHLNPKMQDAGQICIEETRIGEL